MSFARIEKSTLYGPITEYYIVCMTPNMIVLQNIIYCSGGGIEKLQF